MSRSKTINIDRGRFEKAINEVMKTRHFASWSDICADMVVNKDLLRCAAREEKISAKTAKMLEKYYGVTLDQYTPIIEGIFEEQQEEPGDYEAIVIAKLTRITSELMTLNGQIMTLVERSKA